MKRPLLSFSGGLDSTWALYLYLKDPEVEWIDTFYMAGISGPFKAIAELRARKAILDYFQRMFPHKFINDTPGYLEMACHRTNDCQGLKQAMEWLTYAVRVTRKNNTHVATGVILGDGDTLYKTELKQAHDALQLVHNSRDDVVLEWPLAHLTKHRVYEAMHQQIPEIIPHLSVCELQGEDLKACGVCVSCKDHEATVARATWLIEGGDNIMNNRFRAMNVAASRLHYAKDGLMERVVNNYRLHSLSAISGVALEGAEEYTYGKIPHIPHSKVFSKEGDPTPVIQVEPVGETTLIE